MKLSFVKIDTNGIPKYTFHLSFNNTIESGDLDEYGCLQVSIPDGVPDDVVLTQYLYSFAKNELVFVGPSPGDAFERNVETEQWVFNVEKGQADKAKSITLANIEDIYAGYISDALGTSHLYPCNQQDQANMVASVTDSLNPLNDETWRTPFWCADSGDVWEYRLHTAAQIQKAGSDGKAHITACLFKNAGLQAQIAAATTKEELDAIIW